MEIVGKVEEYAVLTVQRIVIPAGAPMSNKPRPEDVEQLLLNAQLRDELEPFLDDSLGCVDVRHFTTPMENDYLASMLAWEKAPVLPIRQWFEPELRIPHPDQLTDEELTFVLWDTIHQLFEKRIVLDFTDHLTDRELYRLIYCDILPSAEKKIDRTDNYLHWDCADVTGNPDNWLRFYATLEEREDWSRSFGAHLLPPQEPPPFPRRLPRRPL